MNSMDFTDLWDTSTIQDYDESWWISIHHSCYITSILGHSRSSVCGGPRQALIINPSQRVQFLLNIIFMHLALQLYTVLHRLTTQHISLLTYNYSEYNLYMLLATTVHSNLKSTKTEVTLCNICISWANHKLYFGTNRQQTILRIGLP